MSYYPRSIFMKKLFLILILALLPFTFFSAPFGLKMGMTLTEIATVCNNKKPEHVENDCYYVFPTKTHPLFKQYVAFVSKEKGLYCLKAVTDDIKTNNYGAEIKNAFSTIKERISKTYGDPKVIDEIASDSLFTGEQYWTHSLSQGARTYAAIWPSNSSQQLKDDLTCVSIFTSAQIAPQVGWIILEYDFSNMKSVEDEQDEVF